MGKTQNYGKNDEGHVKSFKDFLSESKMLDELQRVSAEGDKSFSVDFDDIVDYDMNLARELLENPYNCIEEAEDFLEESTGIPIHFRVKNIPDEIPIRELGEAEVGQFIQIKGIIAKRSDIQPEVQTAVYECVRCGEDENEIDLTNDTKVRKPTICQNPNCGKKGPFRLLSEKCTYTNWQHLEVQERPEELSGGTMPTKISCIVRDDLVNKVKAGDRVVLTGTLKAYQKKKSHKIFQKRFRVNHIKVKEKSAQDLTPEDKKEIESLAEEHRMDRLVIDSIAPKVLGYPEIKEAIAVQLMSNHELTDWIRGNIHILIVGDPSTAKSVTLEWVGKVAPRCIHSSGQKSTGVGLTASVVNDELTGGYTLKAGALTLADEGMAVIDEFDKMDDDEYNAMLEALSQQKININKAGINSTLNTRTTLLAVANPDYGRFDPYESIADQISLPPLILSRFDLIFVIRDVPDEEKDKELAEHKLGIGGNREPELDEEQLRKIISYAKQNYHPKMTDEVKNMIRDFYVEKRKSTTESNSIALTSRQLDALERMSRASARLRFSDVVEEQDFERAKKLLQTYLHQVGVDPETGEVDVDTIYTGTSTSQREKSRLLMDILEELQEEQGSADVTKIKERAKEEGVNGSFVDEWIEREKEKGRLYEPETEKISKAIR